MDRLINRKRERNILYLWLNWKPFCDNPVKEIILLQLDDDLAQTVVFFIRVGIVE